jgi:hypothetical protein
MFHFRTGHRIGSLVRVQSQSRVIKELYRYRGKDNGIRGGVDSQATFNPIETLPRQLQK